MVPTGVPEAVQQAVLQVAAQLVPQPLGLVTVFVGKTVEGLLRTCEPHPNVIVLLAVLEATPPVNTAVQVFATTI